MSLLYSLLKPMVKHYNPNGDLPQYILGKADEDDYTGFPKVIMYFTGDEDCVQKIMDHTGGTGVARPTYE